MQNKQNNPGEEKKEGYIIVPNYFLREWVKVLGIGPALLYLQLLSYCHKEKDIAWPSLTTVSNKLGISKNSLLSYRKILLKYGLIKKIIKRRNTQGNYQSNFYKITPIEGGAKIAPRQVQNLGECSSNIAPGVVQNLHPNNTNLKHYQGNNNKEKDAVVAVDFDFKKLKEEGEEKMRVIKERLRDLDFEGKFIEQLVKDFNPKKIEEKLDLLMERRNIQNPAGWLMAALKNDYQDGQQEDIPIQESSITESRGSIHRARNQETGRINPSPTKTKTNSGDNKKILSTEEVKRRFKLLRHQLAANNYFRKEEI